MYDQVDIPSEYSDVPRELLKHGTGNMSHIILVPQPSDSVNDPLNVSYQLLFICSTERSRLSRRAITRSDFQKRRTQGIG